MYVQRYYYIRTQSERITLIPFLSCIAAAAEQGVGCVTGYQVIRVIRIFAKTYPFEYEFSITRKNRLLDLFYSK